MQVTLCNAKEEPIVIHDTEQSHATQKITGTINQGINAIDSLEFNIYPDNPGLIVIARTVSSIAF